MAINPLNQGNSTYVTVVYKNKSINTNKHITARPWGLIGLARYDDDDDDDDDDGGGGGDDDDDDGDDGDGDDHRYSPHKQHE